MKKIIILGILMVVFVLYNCKDKETELKEIAAPEKTSIEVLQEIDTSVQVSPVKKEVEKSESNVATQKTTTTEANKPIPTLIKVENSTTTVTDPVEKKKTEVVTDIPIETKTKTETEVVTDIPVDTKTEPIVTETPKAWEVPYKYVTMKNPVPAKQDGSIAKSLYDKHCKSCHGKEGYGDGPKAAELTGNLGDFSSAKFQKQTDGELFYKTSFGRDDMPEFYKKIPDAEDIWLVVNYMRTLAE